jgi:K+-sensing histidine kinase KdpD
MLVVKSGAVAAGVDIDAIEHVPALVVFIDADCARLIALMPDRADQEIVLRQAAAVTTWHPRWATLVNAVYHPHVADYRGRHFDAVAQALAVMAWACDVDEIVLAGTAETVAAFRTHLPVRVADRVAGIIVVTRSESSRQIAARGRAILRIVPGDAAWGIDVGETRTSVGASG